jgi:hypothetical protein
MDQMRFDAMAKSFGAAGSRRMALRSVAGIGVASGLAWLGLGSATAKKKRRKHRTKWKKLQKNAYGCVKVGGACRGKDANCCSGICEGLPKYGSKKDTSKCVAHNTLNCPPGADNCQQLGECGPGGVCYQTTGGAGFCAIYGSCSSCQKDTDCETAFGPGAACGVCANCPGGTLCAPPKI